MEDNQMNVPKDWIRTCFGNQDLFQIIGSGINPFEGLKDYYSTSSVERDKVIFSEGLFTFKDRPSRANMQPTENSVWFAKMKNTLKILKPNYSQIRNVILSTGFCGIKAEIVDCDYLFQVLYSEDFNNQKNLLAEGSTQEAVNNQKVKRIEFLMPKSSQEQGLIASILLKVDETINLTETLIAKYSCIKTGLMQDLFTKGIDEHGNIRSEETHEFKDSPLGRIPVEWDVIKMGELITAIDPQPDHRTPPARVDGIPYIGISDFLSNGEIDIKSSRRVGTNVLIKQQKAFSIQKGDLIFGKIGTIGKPTVLPEFHKYHFTLSANVILIKPNECPDFIYWTLISKYIDDQVKLAIHSTSQPAFGMQKIRDLKVITPNQTERDRITNKLNKIDHIISAELVNLAKKQVLKTGLMQDLLSGKVRVNHLIK